MDKLVLTYARKVLSEAKWSLATLPEFSSVRVGNIFFARSFSEFRNSRRDNDIEGVAEMPEGGVTV